MEIQTSRPEEAKSIALRCADMSKGINYLQGLGDAYMRLGSLYVSEGKNDSALFYLEQSKKIRSSLKDYSSVSGTCIMMSYAYNAIGKREIAFAQLYEGIKWAGISKDSARMANIYVSLGNLYMDYKEPEDALLQYEAAEKIALSIQHPQELALALGGLGNYYFHREDYHKAINYFGKKEKIDAQVGNKMALAEVECNLGVCYNQLNDRKKAVNYYQRALHEFTKLGMKDMEALIYFNLGTVFFDDKTSDSAAYYFNKSLEIALELNLPDRVASCYQYLSDYYAQKGNFKQAYDYHLKFAAVNDSIINNEKVKSISEMQTKYFTEKKIQEISLLQANNKAKVAERNIFIVGTVLFLLLAGAILVGLLRTNKQKKISDNLLLNILPEEVAEELKQSGSAKAQYYEQVSVLFTDFKEFTQISEKLNPTELVALLHECFKNFDEIITRYNIEKIKTIGDSYMCAGGLPIPDEHSAIDVVSAALEIQQFITDLGARRAAEGKIPIKMRLGIHTGQVVAGIVGVKKFAYDIWGDTVNTASRMESSGEVGQVNISGTTYELIKDHFNCTYRGKIQAKGKGEVDMYFVLGKK